MLWYEKHTIKSFPKHIQNEFSREVRLKLFATKLKSQTGNRTQPSMAAVECVMGVIRKYGAEVTYLQFRIRKVAVN